MNNPDWKTKIRFISDDKSASGTAIDKVNMAIELDAEFLEPECLVGGLKEYTEEFVVTIKDVKSLYDIDLNPKSGAGHDFSFSVDKSTGRIDRQSLAIGEVLPEHEDDNGNLDYSGRTFILKKKEIS